MRVSNKTQMYDLLGRGAFGNTVPQWVGPDGFDSWLWEGCDLFPQWGIRSTHVSCHPGTKLFVPTEDVFPHVLRYFPARDVQISPMVDAYALFRAELRRGDTEPFGWYLRGGSGDMPGGSWRRFVNEVARDYHGSAVLAVLRHYLWPSDYDDLMATLDAYPDHVVELTACDRAIGVCPNRNTIIWEVRAY